MNENVNLSCALPHLKDDWSAIKWRKVIQKVNRLQRRIAKAVTNKQWGKVKSLMFLVSKSFNAKLLAVFRVTNNKGAYTPGVDKVVWINGCNKYKAAQSLTTRGYSPKPLRRVYIKKKNGKKRPLSIPCMHDRAMQSLFKIALDPLAETTADPNSYGFRARRGCNDAVAQCFLSLCRKDSAQWVFEADIKACFDTINHEWMLENIPINKTILSKWLKAGYVEKGRLFPTTKGTPQGGIISPVLMNMVMDKMETELKNKFPRCRRKKVNFIRYADDFIITAESKEVIENEIIPRVTDFLKIRGLELSEEKSKITHISDGFDFLSQNIRKYNGKLIIKPSRSSIQSFKDKLKQAFHRYRGIPAHALIRILNPIIRGWANYHKGCCAKLTFYKLGAFIYFKLKRWARHEHGNKNRWWIANRYFRNNYFTDQRITKKGIEQNRLYRISHIPIKYHIKIKSKANPYFEQYDEYFKNRTNWREKRALECRQITTFVTKQNNDETNSRVSLRRDRLKSA